jgi:hypothetical protein
MGGFGLGPFGIFDYDGPETIRMRKSATGMPTPVNQPAIDDRGHTATHYPLWG